MPQFDIFTFFIQTVWFTLFFFIFYMSYLKFMLHPLFLALNIRTKIANMTSSLTAKTKKTALFNAILASSIK